MKHYKLNYYNNIIMYVGRSQSVISFPEQIFLGKGI